MMRAAVKLAGKEGLFQILNDAMGVVGATVAEMVAIATQLDTLGYDRIELLEGWNGGCLGRAELDSADVRRLGDEMVAAAGSTIADGPSYRAYVLQLARRLSEHMRGVGASVAEDEEGDVLGVYSQFESRQGRSVHMSDMCVFVAMARSSIVKHGYISSVPGLAKVQHLGVRTRQNKSKLGVLSVTFEDEGKPASVATIEEAKKVMAHVLRGIAAAGSIEIDTSLYGGRDYGWVTVPGAPHQSRMWVTASAIERFIEAFLSSSVRDAAAFGAMFDVVLTRFLNLSQRRGMHADEIIEQIVDREGASFETKAAVRVAVSDAEAVTGTSAGASDDAVAATPAQQGVCQSWLANGSCRLYGNGDCPHGHPQRQRGVYATNPRPGPYDRPGNGGGGGGNGGGYNNRGNNNRGGGNNRGNNNGGGGNNRGNNNGGGRRRN